MQLKFGSRLHGTSTVRLTYDALGVYILYAIIKLAVINSLMKSKLGLVVEHRFKGFVLLLENGMELLLTDDILGIT